MADFDGLSVEYGSDPSPRFVNLVDPVIGLMAELDGLRARRIDEIDAIIVTKTRPGFDALRTAAIREILLSARAGRLGRVKFIAFDFAHAGAAEPDADDDVEAMIAEVGNLILSAPIITVACARGDMAAADLEFALACSMMIGQEGAGFSFGADPIISINTYGLLSQKIGFVRAERLMEQSSELGVAEMKDAYLLKEAFPAGSNEDGLQAFLRRTARRYNSCCGIYRAQRIASPIRWSMGAVA
jgi:enoyl-CoA hydratase/carnithine racemase